MRRLDAGIVPTEGAAAESSVAAPARARKSRRLRGVRVSGSLESLIGPPRERAKVYIAAHGKWAARICRFRRTDERERSSDIDLHPALRDGRDGRQRAARSEGTGDSAFGADRGR